MLVNDRPLKRMKRRVNADAYDFHTFLSAADETSGELFRSSVRCFLSKHAHVTFPPSLFPCLLTWQIMFQVYDTVVALDVVEEDVTRSRSVYCDQCRVVGILGVFKNLPKLPGPISSTPTPPAIRGYNGWSCHPVCQKRYHFIIRANSSPIEGHQKSCSEGGCSLHLLDSSSPIEGHQKSCSECGCSLHLLDSRFKSRNSLIMTDDLEDWLYLQLEDTTHLLHGVIHSNGYGHLLTVNGREGGSKFLSGNDIMNFWNRLCKTLAVRKVSVMDVSKKYGLEYRLLHAITRGQSWYGEWGYGFGAGCYALTLDTYHKAVDTLSSVPLSLFCYQGRGPRTHLQAIIAFYQSLSDSKLVTFTDLFSFLLRLLHKKKPLMPKTSMQQPEFSNSNVLCAWTRDDVEGVQQAIIKVLLAAAGNSSWVTMRALRGTMFKAASPELLDYCLKHLGGKLASNGMVVQARCSPSSEAVEFRLELLICMTNATVIDSSNYPSAEHIIRDLKFLYNSLLHPETMVSYKPLATRELVADAAAKLLDCKKFVKEYETNKMAFANPFAIYIWCHVELAKEPKDNSAPPPELPPELIVLPSNATVGDLKSEATKTFQEVYAMFKRFQAEELLEYGPIDDSMTLKLLVGSSGSVRVQGRCSGKYGLNRFRMERGTENWIVDCLCGATDDDGEGMLACDTCGVWQHTRCVGIGNCVPIPSEFVCKSCVNKYCEDSKRVLNLSEGANTVSQCGTTCRDTVVATNGPRMSVTVGVR